MKLQGIEGSKKALQSNESNASCVALRHMHLSMDRKSASKAGFFCGEEDRVGGAGMIIGGAK
jgi:hypothetical protein